VPTIFPTPRGDLRRSATSGAEIVLVCNPRAGGRWKELAGILDSEEGEHVRRIVTDSVDDIAPIIDNLGRGAKLLCIYGGDGTIQRILDHLSTRHEGVNIAFLGGGTMNVTAHWCGFHSSPAENFREVVRAYLAGRLLFRDVNLLEAVAGEQRHRGFTFGLGPIVRLLDAYEHGRKGKLAALGTATRGIAAALTGYPADHAALLEQFEAEVIVDGETLPHTSFSALFANVTGQINPGVVPFVAAPSRDSFYFAAYAVSAREFTINVPVLMRGWLPVQPSSLLRPDRVVRRLIESGLFKRNLPADPRYVNSNAAHMHIITDERLYTVDGEVFRSETGAYTLSLGLQVRLAVSPQVSLFGASAMKARRYLRRD
jgi:diacylglycerol kinase family enzyme